MAQPIVNEIPKMNININDLGPELVRNMIPWGVIHYFKTVGIRTTNARVVFGEIENTYSMCTDRDMVVLVLRGKADVTYYLLGTHYEEEKKMTIEPGDVYVIPKGAYVIWKVAPGTRERHLVIEMPVLDY